MARLADKVALITAGESGSDWQPRGCSSRRALACTSWALTATGLTPRSRELGDERALATSPT